MDKLFTLSYYFSIQPNPDFQFSKLTFGLALLLILGGIAFDYFRKNKMQDKIARKLLRPYSGKLVRYGLIALFLLVCREYGIPYFSMRLWWMLLLAWMIYQGIKLAVTYKKDYTARLKVTKKSPKIDKYLPKKKKN